MKRYEYFINLDERGEFNSDVRDPDTEETIWEIKDAQSLTDLIDTGYISNGYDVSEIEDYLKEFSIIHDDDEIIEAPMY